MDSILSDLHLLFLRLERQKRILEVRDRANPVKRSRAERGEREWTADALARDYREGVCIGLRERYGEEALKRARVTLATRQTAAMAAAPRCEPEAGDAEPAVSTEKIEALASALKLGVSVDAVRACESAVVGQNILWDVQGTEANPEKITRQDVANVLNVRLFKHPV